MTETKVPYNGQSGDLNTPEGEAVVEAGVRGAMGLPPRVDANSAYAHRTGRQRERQQNMLTQHIEMDEHVAAVEEAMTNLAERLAAGSEISIGVKTPMRVTRYGELLDAKLTIRLECKPAKEEK